MRALNRKLLRDLWAMRSQAIAISLVFGSGIALFVMSRGTFSSLRLTQQVYYRQFGFADVFARAKRVPQRVEADVRRIPGVELVQTRVVVDVTLDVPGLDEAATGELVSLPEEGRPQLNRLYLRRGRWIDPDRPEEVLASEAFVDANHLEIGDKVAATINGRRKELEITGVAMSPEYIYNIRPGDLFPDARRFGVLWMARKPLASAFDMEGGFNDVALSLQPGAQQPDVIARLDRLLEPYGSAGAIPRALQLSHWYLEGELGQLQNMAKVIPTIFLGVAAFLINVVLRRTVAVQREQIAQLKALGYSHLDLAAHYMKWAMVVALLGAALGVAGGVWASNGLLGMYRAYFQFPILEYDWSATVVLLGLLIGAGSAAVGAIGAVLSVMRLPPAEAMRPQPPARYRRSWLERMAGVRWMTAPSRMILRNLMRRPARTGMSIIGIAFAGAIMVIGNSMLDSMNVLMDIQFNVAQRQDVTVSFVEPVSSRAAFELARYPGVERVEPMRAVPARLSHGSRNRQLGITGVPREARLRRIVGGDRVTVPPPQSGLLLTRTLAEVLGVVPGDLLLVEVQEGLRPKLWVPVAGTVDEFIGTAAYMEIDALRRLVQGGDALSGVTLAVDRLETARLMQKLKHTPAVAGVALKQAMIDNFQTSLADNMGTMITLNLFFAVVIAFGVIYNTARISLSERNRELASLRVMGFRRGEIAYILLGELAALTLFSLPLGMVLGYGMLAAAMKSFETELYRIPMAVSNHTYAVACLVVVGASLVSGLIVRRRLDHLDLVGVLKTRE